MKENIIISTPGRICLFGEHQDYLGLPVIAAAISKRVNIVGGNNGAGKVEIDLPDITEKESFIITDEVKYIKERDYLRSTFNVMQRKGFTFSKGIKAKISGDIPINAGASSSTALIVGWVNFLSKVSDQAIIMPAEEIALTAWQAEVAEFAEPGGKMDQYSTSYGGIIYIEFKPEFKVRKLKSKYSDFVLGNSKQPKDTKGILSRVKNGVLDINDKLQKEDSTFALNTIEYNQLAQYEKLLTEDQFELICGTVKNRDITRKANLIMNEDITDNASIGNLLNEHHSVLRDSLKISTAKIDDMIAAGLDAGALGGKINGSGGGGTMFVFAPENPEKVANAIAKISDSYIVKIDEGTKEVVGDLV